MPSCHCTPRNPKRGHRHPCWSSLAIAVLAATLLLGIPEALARDDAAKVPAVPASVPAPAEQSPEDAWWTGPLLASTAATLPQGHLYLEPYLFDSRPYTRFDSDGHGHAVAHVDNFGSLTYVNYGLTDQLTVGLIPHFGYQLPRDGPSSSGIGAGDLTLQGQYRLTRFTPGSWVPDFSINLQESLPVGRYDRLQRSADGFGSGAWTTSVGAYLQSLFWMPNGRILRGRLDVSYAVSHTTSVNGMSVYGTPPGFQGHARPGDSVYADIGLEYSLTRSWVLACDVWLEHDGSTHVRGNDPLLGTAFDSASGSSRTLFVAPAVEYSWTPRAGVIVGARITAAGRNTTASVTPVAALSYFL